MELPQKLQIRAILILKLFKWIVHRAHAKKCDAERVDVHRNAFVLLVIAHLGWNVLWSAEMCLEESSVVAALKHRTKTKISHHNFANIIYEDVRKFNVAVRIAFLVQVGHSG